MNEKALAKRETGLMKLDADELALARRLDEAAELARGPQAGGPFERTFGLAKVAAQLRNLMPLDMVEKHICPLQGSALGFRTDKDKDELTVTGADGRALRTGRTGYPALVVRECLIEAVLRGLRPVNNEFNIIAGREYDAKNGLKRLVMEYPGLSGWDATLSIPALLEGGKTAAVEAVAKWNLNGTACELRYGIETIGDRQVDNRIPVRVNLGMGADGVLGKAEAKLYGRVLAKLTDGAFAENEPDEPEPPLRAVREVGVSDIRPATATETAEAFAGRHKATAATRPAEPQPIAQPPTYVDTPKRGSKQTPAPPPPPPPPAAFPSAYKPCGECGGDGIILGKVCGDCEGRGQIIKTAGVQGDLIGE